MQNKYIFRECVVHCNEESVYCHICYAQRSKTLIGRKKRPQRVLALKKQATMRSFVEISCL